MKWDSNPELRAELVARLRGKYITVRPEMPHLSELLYCLTRSYFDRFEPLAVTEHELIMFSVGFGLEEVLLRNGHDAPKVMEFEGVWMTPDYVVLGPENELDLKSTRMWMADDGQPKRGWPDGWIQQFMAYSYREAMARLGELPQELHYSVGVVYLGPAELTVGTFTFERVDVEHNWERVQTRKNIYMGLIEAGQCPTPFAFNEKWECNNCRYKLRCMSRASQGVQVASSAEEEV